MFGSIPRIPGTVPSLAARTSYTLPAAEKRLMAYSDIELWLQPDLGNARTVGNFTSIAGRKGWAAQTDAPTIGLTTGLTDTLGVVSFPGGNIPGKTPLHVPNYEITSNYFMAIVLHWDAAVALTGEVYHIASAGIHTGADVELYMLNNGLHMRHGDLWNASSASQFAANTSYLVWASYDATLNKAVAGINSLTPLTWAVENLAGDAGAGRPVCIGGRFDAGGVTSNNLFKGQIRAAFIGRTAWVSAEKQPMRNAFLSDLASLYTNDFTMV